MEKIIMEHSFTVTLPDLAPSSVPLQMTWIPPGRFTMGNVPEALSDPLDPEQETPFEVGLSYGFWLGTYPVTQSQWVSLMGINPSVHPSSDDHPVNNITWYQAMQFCFRLNQRFSNALPEGYRFSLPTEAQWEYACLAGCDCLYGVGNSIDDLSDAAWHANNSDGHLHPVGQKRPNAFGIYDMLGNVYQWCYDSPPPAFYPSDYVQDWIGTGDGFIRNFRGGSYGTPPTGANFLCASRGYTTPDTARPWIGMRLCLRFHIDGQEGWYS